MLDLMQLRSFVSVAEAGSFTLAARRLELSQSTVSQHIQRLEKTLQRRLVRRDTHSVGLTPDGETLLPHARQLLSLEKLAKSRFESAEPRGTLRLGVSEDLVAGQLPLLLGNFVADYPSVDLELSVELSRTLYDMLARGALDLVLAKRRIGEAQGMRVGREPLVWLARDPDAVLAKPSLPLILFPPPSLTRAILLEALERAGVGWHVVCSCQSLSGLTAAARAGMGVLVQPRSMIPHGLKEIDGPLPALEDVEFVLSASKSADPATVDAFTRRVSELFSSGLKSPFRSL
jgi:DNA-binding transcriptional LysR family regulator